jgi:magnesium-transporting ATPase (P-type)
LAWFGVRPGVVQHPRKFCQAIVILSVFEKPGWMRPNHAQCSIIRSIMMMMVAMMPTGLPMFVELITVHRVIPSMWLHHD